MGELSGTERAIGPGLRVESLCEFAIQPPAVQSHSKSHARRWPIDERIGNGRHGVIVMMGLAEPFHALNVSLVV